MMAVLIGANDESRMSAWVTWVLHDVLLPDEAGICSANNWHGDCVGGVGHAVEHKEGDTIAFAIGPAVISLLD